MFNLLDNYQEFDYFYGPKLRLLNKLNSCSMKLTGISLLCNNYITNYLFYHLHKRLFLFQKINFKKRGDERCTVF